MRFIRQVACDCGTSMYRDKILNFLRAHPGEYVSGEELARKCGISRTMVWKHIRNLEREGFGIEAVPSQGYRVTSTPDVLRLSDICSGLATRLVGREVVLLPSIDSTNREAMERALHGAEDGTAVVAETQTGGRGRLGRRWHSPPGNLYFSIILRPGLPLHKAPLMTLMAAVAVCSALRDAGIAAAGIKWPNDILVSGRKVSGILTEMSAEQDRIRHIVLGVGINVNMPLSQFAPDLRERSTTVAEVAGHAMDRNALLREVLRRLDRWYGVLASDPAAVLREWTALNVTLGRRVNVQGADGIMTGLARSIDVEGRLIVSLDDGSEQRVAAGDVTILKI